MKAGLIAYLLSLLDGNNLKAVKNSPSVKAQIVKALKAMLRSMEYGEQVRISGMTYDQSCASFHVTVCCRFKLNLTSLQYGQPTKTRCTTYLYRRPRSPAI